MSRKRDEMLDHEVDGIREFDNDLPRWWLYSFYFTILLGAVYLVNYHVLPEPLVGPASIQAEYEADVAAAAATRPAPAPAAAAGGGGEAAGPAGGGAAADQVALTDADSLAKGQAVFESATHPCVACHRPDLGGLVGPDLTDDRWLHGCSIGDVVAAIKTGFPLQGMLPYGGGSPLSDEQTLQVASYILSKQGTNPAAPKAPDPVRDQVCP